MYLEQKFAGLFRCLNCETFSRTKKGKPECANQFRVARYSTLSRLEYPGDHRKNYKKNKFMICNVLLGLPERCPKLMGHRSQKVTFDLESTCKNDTELSWKEKNIEDPCGFQGIFATLSGIFKGFLLCRYHSEILLRSGLYRAKEKGIGHADICLLT
jgi:hypothetical protein